MPLFLLAFSKWRLLFDLHFILPPYLVLFLLSSFTDIRDLLYLWTEYHHYEVLITAMFSDEVRTREYKTLSVAIHPYQTMQFD